MSEALVVSAAEMNGAATVREVPSAGMITVKADLSDPALRETVQEATGCAVPDTRAIVTAGQSRVAWMAPDEVLVLVPREDLAKVLATLNDSLQGMHALVADVSDMRAMFRVESGIAARETLAKLCPVDLAPGAFEAGELRRTRLAQIAAAFWMEDDGFTVVCFRSVAQYAFDALSGAADANGRVGYFAEA